MYLVYAQLRGNIGCMRLGYIPLLSFEIIVIEKWDFLNDLNACHFSLKKTLLFEKILKYHESSLSYRNYIHTMEICKYVKQNCANLGELHF